MLERQTIAKSKNEEIVTSNNDNEFFSKIDQLIEFLKGEMDLMTTLVEAEISLEKLLEDRRIISDRVAELSGSLKDSLENPCVEKELENLQEDLKVRNDQIDNMQKTCGVDLETHLCSMVDNIHSMMGARSFIKHLWKTTLDMRRETVHSIQALKNQLSLAEEKCTELTRHIETLNMTHQNVIQEYEEKMALVLTPEEEQNFKQQIEQQKTIDILKRKVDNYAQLLQNNLPESFSSIKGKASLQFKIHLLTVIYCESVT